jgi:hypothetical protein
MRAKLLQKRGATAPVTTMPSGPLHNFDESTSTLFCTEEEDDAAIQAILEEDPEGEDGIPLEQFRAETNRLIASLTAESMRRIRDRKVG